MPHLEWPARLFLSDGDHPGTIRHPLNVVEVTPVRDRYRALPTVVRRYLCQFIPPQPAGHAAAADQNTLTVRRPRKLGAPRLEPFCGTVAFGKHPLLRSNCACYDQALFTHERYLDTVGRYGIRAHHITCDLAALAALQWDGYDYSIRHAFSVRNEIKMAPIRGER